MSLENALYGIVIFFIILAAFVVITYNNRLSESKDTYEVEDDYDYEKHSENNSKVIINRDEHFNWDVKEDEQIAKNEKFLGLNSYLNQGVANERIIFLQNEFKENKIIYLNMVEILLLVEQYSSFIKLKNNGGFEIGKKSFSVFINSLEYDNYLVEKISKIKKEYAGNKKIEIDASKLFLIMRNAENIGLSAITDNTQFFKIISKANQSDVLEDAENNKDEFVQKVTVN